MVTQYSKHFVRVVEGVVKNELIYPTIISWDDGRQFSVEVLDEPIHTRCKYTDGYAMRYRILVNRNANRFIYRDGKGRWFVEINNISNAYRDPRKSFIPG